MGFRLDEPAISTRPQRRRWPGRLERLKWNGAEVILDAAHNPAGAMVLAAHLRRSAGTGSRPSSASCVTKTSQVCWMRSCPAAPALSARRRRARARCRPRAWQQSQKAARNILSKFSASTHRRWRCVSVPAGSACRWRRIDLSDRSPAWYSSLIRPRLRAVFACCTVARPCQLVSRRVQPTACIAASCSPSFSLFLLASTCPACWAFLSRRLLSMASP